MQNVAEFCIPDECEISDEHLINVCRYRQKTGCCRYIVWLLEKEKFYCGKTTEKARKFLDEQALKGTAQADNCEGIPCGDKDQSESCDKTT